MPASVGSVVRVRTVDLKPYGIVCRLPGDARKTIIRYWDWDWTESLTFESAQARSADVVGREVECRVRGYEPHYDELLLSPREARPEEWARLASPLRPRAIVEGEVTRYEPPATYFVRLDMGLVARLAAETVPPLPAGMSRGLLIGDRVRAVVESVDPEGHCVVLNVTRWVNEEKRLRRANRHAQEHPAGTGPGSAGPQALPGAEAEPSSPAEGREQLPPEPAHGCGPLSIGWVDDEEERTRPMRQLLEGRGIAVELVPTDLQGFLAGLRSRPVPFDLLVVDIDLGSGPTGLELVRAATEAGLLPAGRVLFFTGVSRPEPLLEARLLEPLDVLAKGTDERSLLRYAAGETGLRPRFAAADDALQVFSEGDAPYREPGFDQSASLPAIEATLEGLVEAAGASSALVVTYEQGRGFSPVTRVPQVRAVQPEPYLSHLLYSPVMDVIRGGQPYWDPRCAENPKRYEHLALAVGRCETLRVVPVSPFGTASHAVVVMDGDPHGARWHRQMDDVAHHVRTILENGRMWELTQQLNTAAETGMMAVGVVHDLNGGAFPLIAGLELVQEVLRGAGPWRDERPERRLELIGPHVQRLRQNVVRLLEPIRRLLDRVRGKEEPSLDPMAAVVRAREVIRSLEDTKDARVEVAVKTAELPGAIPGSSLKLEQILFNLLLNAVQQIKLSGYTAGKVSIEPRVSRQAGGGSALVIAVRDTGPGIHRCDFERVFDFGFSTRPRGQGTGIGLFHTRQLARSLGAEVRVASSVLFAGTEFVVTLPLR